MVYVIINFINNAFTDSSNDRENLPYLKSFFLIFNKRIKNIKTTTIEITKNFIYFFLLLVLTNVKNKSFRKFFFLFLASGKL